MKVRDILKGKSSNVETVSPTSSLALAVNRLSARAIGALVVSEDGERPSGLLGERDIVRALARQGGRALDLRVSDVMQRAFTSCHPDDPVKLAMEEMTRTRQRHLPVVAGDGRLVGILSVGDIVKSRLDEVELETQVLRDAYISRH